MQNRILQTLSALFVSFVLFAQNKIDYYEYWFDGNVAGKVSQSITPVAQFQLNTALPTTGLTNGLHTVHIRFRDENNRFSSVLSAFFLKNGTSTATSNQMSSYEYWFDQDYAGRVSGALPASQWVNFSTLAPTNGLSAGLHTAHIRFRDANGQWGSVLSQFFLKQGTSIAPGTPALTEYEYWFNSDFANAQQVSLAGNATEQVIAAIDATSLQAGLNKFHVRFRDANGQWSSVLSQFFIKSVNAPGSSNQMTAYEYWFDSDYANRVSTSVAGNPYAAISGNLDANSLAVGLHTLHIRFQDATHQWSSVLSSFFVKNAPTSSLSNSIHAYRYWFDGNSANMVNNTISSPQQTVSITDPVSMVQIPKGTHTIHFQFLDAQGLWSSVTTDTIYKNSLPIAQFAADSTQFCDAGTVQFSNSSIDGEDYLWDFGDGQTSTDSIPLHTYAAPGIYSVSLTTSDPAEGLDSTLTQVQLVTVYETPDASIQISGNDTICAGSSVTLSSATPPANYLWSNGSSNTTLDVNSAGSYWVEVSNLEFAACISHSDTIEIAVAPLPDASFTFSNVDHVVSFTNTSPIADTYFWNFGDGNTSAAPNPVHDYAVNGLYTAYLVAYNFCGTDTAFASVDLQFIGMGEGTVFDQMYLYPNPTNGAVTVALPTIVAQGLRIVIYSERGDLIVQKEQLKSDLITLDLSAYQNGTYFIHVSSANGWYGIQKVVLNR